MLIFQLNFVFPSLAETLRKYPVTPILTRQCTKDYEIPGTSVTLEKGTAIIVPTLSLQRDEKFCPEPLKFDPMRFSNENSSQKTFVDRPYLPFGDGPRACIGRRMAKMLMKVGIAAILQKCSVELDDQVIEHEFQFTPIGAFLRPKHGIHLQFKTRKVVVKSTQRTDFLDLIDRFSPGESEFSRAVRAAQPMRPIPKTQRPNFVANRKRMSLR